MSSRRRLQRPLPSTVPFDPIIPILFDDRISYESATVIDDLVKRTPKMEVPKKVIPKEPAEREIVLVQEIKDQIYRNLRFSTAPAVVDQPLGLRSMGVVADTMTVLAIGGGFTYKLNSPANDASPAAVVGLQEDQFEIEEIYITTTGVAGTAIVRINVNPLLIRVRGP